VNFPQINFSQIDDLTRQDHSYLDASDECLYLREYTARGGFNHSETNHLIINLKKEVDRKGRQEYKYKEQAIQKVISEFKRVNWNKSWLRQAVLVPMPPSKVKTDPLYDARITQIVSALAQAFGSDMRELITLTENMCPSHSSATRATPSEIRNNYEIDEDAVPSEAVTDVGLFDDVLTTGAHFKAAKAVLTRRFPNVRVVGIFVARRVFAQPDPDESI
jgi:predicted amidophosphoribosyltransferase